MTISISRAGRLVLDDNGLVHARLITIEVVDSVDDRGKERTELEWSFEVPTTKGTAIKRLWTGLNVNAKKTYYPTDENGVILPPEYNKLTQVTLSLGLIDEVLLHSDADIDLDLQMLIGKDFTFAVIPQKLKPHLSDIVLTSLRFKPEEIDNGAAKALTVGRNR